jgi:hypothetical protein
MVVRPEVYQRGNQVDTRKLLGELRARATKGANRIAVVVVRVSGD